ncbi:MAG: 1-acyl-sn-glycerol-3-phosphate acyltransferase [Lachnospira sp.]|nr:1-acyl-sn-glycerol-3-phosphate acyltransferase [Lachnospira sp.]
MRKLLRPIILKIVTLQRKHKFIYLNQHPDVTENVIYTFNHSCKHDTPYAFQTMKGYGWLLAGKQRLEFIDRLAFIINGTVWVNRKDKDSKKKASNKMLKLLAKKQNILMFPEGTWNLTASTPVLPLYWGCIELARQSKCPILPVALEYINDEVYIKFGQTMYVTKEDDKSEKIEELEDAFATLKYDIWSQFPVIHRENGMKEEWDKEVLRRVTEYPKLDYEYEMSCIRKRG